MKYIKDCIDYKVLKENLSKENLIKVDKVLQDFINFQIKNDDGNIDIIGKYTSLYGNSYIIDWYEDIITTNEFLQIMKENYN